MHANNYIKAVVRAEDGRILAQTFVPFNDTDPAQCENAARDAAPGVSCFRAFAGCGHLPVIGKGGGFA